MKGSIYTKLVSRVLFPFHEKLKNHATTRVFKELEESQWRTLEQIEKYQVARLKRFLMDVSEHVPFYNSMFAKCGFDPAALHSVKELQKLPLLTKAVIQAHTERLKANNAHGLSTFNTGGSTGEPLIFFLSNERVSHDVAAKWRATRWWDVDIGDKEIVIWGSPIEVSGQDRIKVIRDKILRTKLLPAFQMNEQTLKKFISDIRAFKPKMLFGYPSALSYIASFAETNNLTMSDLGIKVAFVTSEKLYDEQRETISRVFGCPVANGYGGRDSGFIAHQCPNGSMHITAEDIIVEIIDSHGNVLPAGQAGEIVVTHMATRDFPFIRYRTGDVGVLDVQSECSCGRGLPILKEVQGRSTDFVISQDGTVMHGLSLIYVVRNLPGIKAFKIVQESKDLTRVQLVGDDSFLDSNFEAIEEGFKSRLGNTVDIKIELVSDIPAEKSGKFRYVISKVT